MEIKPQIFTAKVMHKRLFPKVNGFIYKIYYLVLPLSQLKHKINKIENTISYNKFGILSFYDQDHGKKNGNNLENWIRKILKDNQINNLINEVMLVSMPRVFGYVFNPVSFWFCLDNKKKLRAVLCQVNNTFGETHSYLCVKPKGQIIGSDDWIEAKKLFHVSPFLKREGYYKFRFICDGSKLKIWIDFYNNEGKKQLVTSLIGHLKPLTAKNMNKIFCKHPLVTFKTIFLIHWQAVKLIIKGIKYISKPKQKIAKFSSSKNIK